MEVESKEVETMDLEEMAVEMDGGDGEAMEL